MQEIAWHEAWRWRFKHSLISCMLQISIMRCLVYIYILHTITGSLIAETGNKNLNEILEVAFICYTFGLQVIGRHNSGSLITCLKFIIYCTSFVTNLIRTVNFHWESSCKTVMETRFLCAPASCKSMWRISLLYVVRTVI